MKLFATLRAVGVYLVIIMLPVCPVAQPWMRDVPNERAANFYEVQQAFNNYWRGRVPEGKGEIPRGKGYKQFKRWEWFWEPRVGKEGIFPSSSIIVDEWEKYRATHSSPELSPTVAPSGGSNVSGNWVALGPSSSNGGYAGVGRLDCIAFHPTDPNTFWVGSPSGGLWKTTTGGASWIPLTDNMPVLGVSAIAVSSSNPNTIYIATGDRDHFANYSVGVLKSTNGGASWSATSLRFTVSEQAKVRGLIIHPTNSQILIAATSEGIYRTTNSGANWTLEQSGNFHEVLFKPGAPAIVYASSGGSAQVFRSTDKGDTWTQVTAFNGINRIALATTPANPSIVGALCSNSSTNGFGGYYTSTNSGASFDLTYAAAGGVNLLGYSRFGDDNGGQGWYDLCLAISPTNANIVFAGGVNTWKSDNGGTSWSINTMWWSDGFGTPTVHADKHSMAFSPLHAGALYQCNDGGLYKTENYGSSWTDLSNGLYITQFYRFGNSATNSGLTLAGAQDNGTKLRNSSSYSDHIGGDGMEAIINYTNANTMYGSLYFGDIQKSINGGVSWSRITGSLPGGAWVTPYVIDPANPATLYLGTGRSVYKTTNEGASWIPISGVLSSSDLQSLAVAPSDPQVIYAGSHYQLYKTASGGGSWSYVTLPAIQALTSIEIHPSNPQIVWITFSGYVAGNKVFKSENGGVTWTNISGTLPNLPVNTIEYDKITGALYIGNDMGVFVRQSSVDDWQVFDAGLPNVIVNELEIYYNTNHNLSRLRAATYGRGLWESSLSSGPAEYCAPLYTEGCSSLDVINNFIFNTLVNTNSGCGSQTAPGYTNYAPEGTLTTSISWGKSYELKLQSGKDRKQGFSVWIDYNGDKDFDDDGEFVYTSRIATKRQLEAVVTIPASATLGATRLRVRSKYDAAVTSAESCSTLSYGETEDYTIVILDNNTTPAVNTTASVVASTRVDEVDLAGKLKMTALPNPSSTTFSIVLHGNKEMVDLRVMDVLGRLVEARSKMAAGSVIKLGHNYKPGTYYVEILQNGQRAVLKLVKLSH